MSKTVAILIILLIGVLYRLILTSNGDFIFNMDNARDMVDVREMVVLHKWRLTGPTSAIDGFYNGPAWYYVLAIPFMMSGGDPYAEIILQIFLWGVGGYFLLKLIGRWNWHLILPIGFLWIGSNYILLTNVYAFNPNPVTLLSPLLIYLIEKFIFTKNLAYSILMWFLGGMFFNFEMNAGIFIPAIIILSVILLGKYRLLKERHFWIGFLFFLVTLLPQLIFDIRHQFIMSKSLITYLAGFSGHSINPLQKIMAVMATFYSSYLATLMNQKILAPVVLGIFFIFIFKAKKMKLFIDPVFTISFAVIATSLLGYILFPVKVNPWHLGQVSAATILMMGFLLDRLTSLSSWGKIVGLCLSVYIIFSATETMRLFLSNKYEQSSIDPSLFRNEISAIDYVYQKAGGKNFKVYTYLPSVIDYPYQYLFWWYGLKQYGYTPVEYAYSPNKPQYISNKEKFSKPGNNSSGLIFLIKEPDRIRMRQAWENDYKDMRFISKEMVGPLEIEVRNIL